MTLRSRLGHTPRLLLAFLLAFALFVPSALRFSVPVHAAGTTWTVTSTGDTASPSSANCNGSHQCATLRDALVSAQDGDSIDLTGLSGVITTTSTLTVTTDVTVNGPGAAQLAVSGNGDHRVVEIDGTNTTVSISGLTIEDGVAPQGAGIANAGRLTVRASAIRDNSASGSFGGILAGAGIYTTGALTVTGSTIASNTMTSGIGSIAYGAGIYSIGGTLVLTDSTVLGNTIAVSIGGGGDGAGIYRYGSLTMRASTVAGNAITPSDGGGQGGGLYLGGANGTVQFTVRDSTIADNTAGQGGGIYALGSGGTLVLSLTGTTVSGNSASEGGGIYNIGFSTGTAVVQVTDSTIAGNTASAGGSGGGVFNLAFIGTATLTLTASTVTGNTASNGGGVYSGTFESGTPTVAAVDSVLAGNPGAACSGAVTTDGGGNLDDDGSCGFSTANGSITHATTPGLGTLGTYGGPTQTIPLLPGSQAVGLGVPAGCTANGGLDQRGVARPATGCDSGAFQGILAPITPPTLPAGTVDTASTQALSLTGGVAPITYTSSLTPPAPGLSLGSSSGVLAGTPTTAGTYPFTVTAVDSVGDVGSRPYTLTIQRAQPLLSLAAAPTIPTLGSPLSVTVTLTPTTPTAPTGTVTLTVTTALGVPQVLSGTLGPAGQVTLHPASSPGTVWYTLTASYGGDGNFLPGSVGPEPVLVPVATLPLAPTTLPAGTVDSAYTQPLSLTDGQVPVTYTTSPAPPAPGLSLGGSSGVLAGTPSTAGTYPFTVRATDAVGEAGSQPYTLTIQRAATSLALTAPARANLGQSIPVTATLTAPTSPTAPTGTVVVTLTSNLGTTSVLTGTLTGLQAGVTFPGQVGAASYTVAASYSGDANFLPSGTSLGAGSITQLGCAVSGSVLDRGVGSLSVFHLQVPASGPGQVTGSVDGVLTVNQPVLAACLTGGTSQSATITGTAGGSSGRFRPGTSLSVQLAVSGGQATATISGSNGQTVVLSGPVGSSRFGLNISAV